MKNFRFSIVIMVTVFFVAGTCSVATAASAARKPVMQNQASRVKIPSTVKPVINCPQGWHQISSYPGGGFRCKPNKPQPQTCPDGFGWTDASQTGCFVGCDPLVY